jgi:hypothetical protein
LRGLADDAGHWHAAHQLTLLLYERGDFHEAAQLLRTRTDTPGTSPTCCTSAAT